MRKENFASDDAGRFIMTFPKVGLGGRRGTSLTQGNATVVWWRKRAPIIAIMIGEIPE